MKQHRISFDLSQESLDQLNELQRRAGFDNRAELVKAALRMYVRWIKFKQFWKGDW